MVFIKNWQGYSLTNLKFNKTDYVFAGAGGIIKFSNWGDNWIIVNNGIPRYPITLSITNKNNIIYTGIDTPIQDSTGIYKSTNLGNSWQLINAGFFIYSKYIYSCESLVLSGGSNEVAMSKNYGNNWSHIPGIINNSYLFGFASNGIRDIFISSFHQGFYVSNDSGKTWNLRNEGLGNIYPTALHRFGNYLYISLNPNFYYGGIYRHLLSEVIGINNISREIPNSTKLYQNYPNPFNPVTKINYDLPKDCKINLVIYDMFGREIKTLVNEYKSAGRYTVEFNGSGFASGIYFYRIQAGDFMQVKHMVLVK